MNCPAQLNPPAASIHNTIQDSSAKCDFTTQSSISVVFTNPCGDTVVTWPILSDVRMIDTQEIRYHYEVTDAETGKWCGDRGLHARVVYIYCRCDNFYVFIKL